MNVFNSAIYNILEWISRFAYVNILWILFTFAGGIILGFYPSSIAMFAMIRDWLRGNTDKPVFKTFWKYYRQEFVKSNLLGLVLNVMLLLIAFDIYYIQMNINENLTWTHIPLFAFMLLIALFLFYIFPSFVHFRLNVYQLIKNAFLVMLISPIHSFLITVSLISSYFIFRGIPALFFIFGGPVYAFITTWICLHAFDRIQKRQQIN
ncbi:YesL family protein [Oceanobacillus massiliensis]|uniref:YesL family protein n=1 Tax=Oceanobacillus massiliensis TaxID=1465765 RepID=UPI003019B27F